MADNGNEYNEVFSASSVYAVTDIQGFLERKGVLGNKTKLWCSLQSSTLYMQKKQGDAMKTIDLKDCHQVRKVTSEITGTHLEICERKKTHVFVCPTSENCTAWVKALQAAMALKDYGQVISSHLNNNQENTDDTNVYEICDYSVNPPQRDQKASVKLSSQYVQPYDTQKVNSTEIKENEYWEVETVQGKLKQLQSTKQSSHINNNASSIQNHSEQIYEDARSERNAADQSIGDEESYSDASSMTQTVRGTPTVSSQSAPAVERRISNTRIDVGCKDNVYSFSYSAPNNNTQISFQKTETFTNIKLPVSDTNAFPDTDEDDSLLQILTDALSDHDSSIPDYIHPLTDQDSKPAEDLLQFLSDNQEFCQVSYSLVPISDDPVNSLRSYLETTGFTLKGSCHS